MMNYLRPHVPSMTGYVPGFQPEESGWVKLNQNENPYPPSPAVAPAIEAEIRNLRTYPETSSRRVREEAARIYQLDPTQVLVSNGSDEMLRILFESCVGEGEEVVAFYPSYTYYKTLAEIQNATFRLIEFDAEYQLPSALDVSAAKLVFLPNPNAPSGTVVAEDEIRRLCAAAVNGLVVIDEAYADFDAISALPLLDELPNLFVTRTFSKSYSLAGLRLGLGFGNADLMTELDKVRDFYNVDRLAQVAAVAALQDQEYLRAACKRIRDTRARLSESLKNLGIRHFPSSGNFILAQFESPSAKTVYEALCKKKILVRHFAKPRVDDCLRISIGTDAETDALVTALQDILQS